MGYELIKKFGRQGVLMSENSKVQKLQYDVDIAARAMRIASQDIDSQVRLVLTKAVDVGVSLRDISSFTHDAGELVRRLEEGSEKLLARPEVEPAQ